MKWTFLLLLLNSHILAQDRYSILITEFMADPTPAVNLPSNEWIELKNVSSTNINLQGWRIGDATSLSGPMPAYQLAPDSFVIICNTSSLQNMSVYGNVVTVTSFPSLDNDGDQLFLRSSTGSLIHAIDYSDNWYNNVIKSEGGWTLEMIDTHSPCTGMLNWKASIDPKGGTPAKKNSIDAINADEVAPALIRTYARDSISIVAVFDESIDSLSASIASHFSFTNSITVINARPIAPFFREVLLTINNPLIKGIVYQLTVSNITDCSGNEINELNKCKSGLPEKCAPVDIVINEILFNPRAGGFDFIELFNRSTKVIDASSLFIANRATNGSLNAPQQLTAHPFYVFPNDHLVITPDEANIALNYHVPHPENIIEHTLPSFPDDEGTAVLMNVQNNIIDELNYKDDWHFALISDAEGVSLERISIDDPTNDPHNWHSASSTSGFATPGHKNSQSREQTITNAEFYLENRIISPDNDGIDDMITLHYRMNEPGYMANVFIYDVSGSMKHHFIKNQLLGLSGTFRWDGITSNGEVLPVGPYILLTQVFNSRSVVRKFKNVFVVAKF